MKDSVALKYCSAELGADVGRVVELVAAIKGNTRYQLGDAISDFLTEVADMAATAFATFIEICDKIGSERILRGKAALRARFDYCEKSSQEDGVLRFEDLAHLHVFSYAFSPAEQAHIRQWTLACWAASPPVHSASAAGSSSSGARDVVAVKRCQDFDDELERLAQ